MLPGDVYYYSANSCVLCVKRGQLKKVTKPPGLNPNANIFTSSKLVATPAEKDWETREEFLTNGDLKQDEVGGGFSSGDSPVSTSPPVQGLDTTSGGPQVLGGGTGLGVSNVAAAFAHMVTVDAAASAAAEDEDTCVPVILPTVQMPNGLNSMGHEGVSASPASVEGSLSPDRLRALLKQQLEYYFSRENLVHDQYLQSQMDSDQYVPIATVASFNLVQKLTHDLDLIVEVLRASKQVQVDEKGEKVRPKHSRSVLMLREIPETTPIEEVRALFDGENCPKVVSCEFAHNSYWYITFETDEDATQAYRYLREEKKTFLNKPIMARIKARPLMRTGGPYMVGKAVPRQPAPEAQNFLRQQPAYPIVTPISTFVSGQVAQPFYLPPAMSQWGTPTTPTFLDPGAMLAMNGYQATSIKPSTNNNRTMYPVRNNRGPKPHHRSQIASEKSLEQRSLDRSHNSTTNSGGGISAARASPRNSSSNNATLETSHSVPFSRTRSEGSATTNHSHGHAHSHSASASSSASHIEEGPSPASTSAKSEQTSTSQKRGGNYRRRRNDDGARSSRAHQNHQNKDGKAQHELSFELEPLSFPPLPGQLGNSSSSDAPEGNKLSDVVKGTARQGSRLQVVGEKETKPASLVLATPSGALCAPLVSGPSSAAVHSVLSDSALSHSPVVASVSSAPVHGSAAVVSAISPLGIKETLEPSVTPATYARTSSASTIVTAEPSALPRPSKTSSVTTASITSSTETTTVSKQAAVNSSAVKHSAVSVGQEMPPRLSYAQMVQRKQIADGVEKQKTDDPSLQPASNASVTRPSAQTLREQSQTQTVNAITASATPKSACASVKSWNKEPARKDYEPREQRFQGIRRSKENRDRQQRPERRCSEREVRVVAK